MWVDPCGLIVIADGEPDAYTFADTSPASEAVVDSLRGLPERLADARDERALEACMREALTECNTSVCAALDGSGLGASVVVLAVAAGSWCVGSVGDARAYRASGASVMQVHPDHSMFDLALRKGEISIRDFGSYPFTQVVLEVIGLKPHVSVRTSVGRLSADSTFLLCSRGLWQSLGPLEMLRRIDRAHRDDALTADSVLSWLPDAHDDVTCAVARIEGVHAR
jgi:serine/threonine protein phosphatase PrpC